MLLPMAKIEIIGPKKYFYDVLSSIHSLGVLHIEDMSKELKPGDMIIRKMVVDEEVVEQRRLLEELQVKVSAIITTLKPSEKVVIPTEEKNHYYNSFWREDVNEIAKEVEDFTAELELKTRDLAKEKSNLELKLASISKYHTVVDKIKPLAKQLVALEGFETIALLIEKKYKAVLDVIREELSNITKDQFEVVSADVDDETTAALVIFNKIYTEQVHSFLWSENVNQVRLPEELADEPFDVALEKMKQESEEIPAKLAEVVEKLKELSKEWYVKLVSVNMVLTDKIEELQQINHFGQTDFTFVITGWMPRKYIKNVDKSLTKEFKEDVILSEVKVSEHELEQAPIKLQNPGFVKPFESILKLFGVPRYGTVDPTPFLALFIPIFFGLIIGDMGYGLVIGAVALLLRYKYRNMEIIQAISFIFLISSGSAIVFGFFFGEFFGNLPHRFHLIKEVHLGKLILPFDRMAEDSIVPFLLFCLGVGVAHIVLGLILGMVNAVRHRSKKHFIEKWGFLTVLGGIGLMILGGIKIAPTLTTNWGILTILIGVVLTTIGAGFIGPFEIFSLLGKIISYARLMALGLASVVLAMVANQLAGELGSVAVGIVVAGLLHAINIVVGAFSPTIHSIRLNVIEFFGQFYESGGEEYKPFHRTGGE